MGLAETTLWLLYPVVTSGGIKKRPFFLFFGKDRKESFGGNSWLMKEGRRGGAGGGEGRKERGKEGGREEMREKRKGGRLSL